MVSILTSNTPSGCEMMCFPWKWSNFMGDGLNKLYHAQTRNIFLQLGGNWLINICCTHLQKKMHCLFCCCCRLYFLWWLIGGSQSSYKNHRENRFFTSCVVYLQSIYASIIQQLKFTIWSNSCLLILRTSHRHETDNQQEVPVATKVKAREVKGGGQVMDGAREVLMKSLKCKVWPMHTWQFHGKVLIQETLFESKYISR